MRFHCCAAVAPRRDNESPERFKMTYCSYQFLDLYRIHDAMEPERCSCARGQRHCQALTSSEEVDTGVYVRCSHNQGSLPYNDANIDRAEILSATEHLNVQHGRDSKLDPAFSRGLIRAIKREFLSRSV